jgi:hypothetical protein
MATSRPSRAFPAPPFAGGVLPGRWVAAALALLALLLAGCSHTGVSGSGSGGPAIRGAAGNTAIGNTATGSGAIGNTATGSGASGSGALGTAAEPAAPQAGAPAQPATGPVTPLQTRQLVRTADVSVTVPDVDRAAAIALDAATAAGGRLDSDDRGGARSDRHAHLVLRVPPAGLAALLKRVVGLGQETSRTEQGQDVTAAVADVGARVAQLQISVGRLQDFMRRAGSLADLLTLESQLTQRESDLQSTIAQQRALADDVQLATLTVDLTATAPPVRRHAAGPPGFGSALLASLHGLWLAGRVTVAGLGYLVPALVILGPVGFVVLRVRRRNRRPAPEPQPAA